MDSSADQTYDLPESKLSPDPDGQPPPSIRRDRGYFGRRGRHHRAVSVAEAIVGVSWMWGEESGMSSSSYPSYMGKF